MLHHYKNGIWLAISVTHDGRQTMQAKLHSKRGSKGIPLARYEMATAISESCLTIHPAKVQAKLIMKENKRNIGRINYDDGL